KPLSEVDAVVSALYAAIGQPAPVEELAVAPRPDFSAPVAASPSYEAGAAAPVAAFARPTTQGDAIAPQQAVMAAAPEPKRAAVVKREARARDLFATRSGEELQASAPSPYGAAALGEDESRLTGQRNENSVLFSLDHLARNATPEPPQSRGAPANKDDS